MGYNANQPIDAVGNMGDKMIKAVIFDLDNTLLRTDKSLSDYSRGVLARCRKRGIYVFAASARPERTVREFGIVGEFEALVTLNGARVLIRGRELVNAIARESGERIAAGLLPLPDALVSVEMSGGIYASAPIPEWNASVFTGFPRLPEGTLYKVLVSGVTEAEARAALTEDTYCTAIEGGKLYQFMSREATKWGGVREMLAAFGVSPQETAYFGDDWDDIECVKNCGLGVAMENAIPEVKAAADGFAGHCDGDGAARYVEENIL